MDDDFDEFGNYVGEEYSDSEAADGASDQWDTDQEPEGDGVETEYFRHDTQDIAEPLFKTDRSAAQTSFTPRNWELHSGILREAHGLVRNVALVGDVNHGKTGIAQLLLEESDSQYSVDSASEEEKQRALTMKCAFMSFLVQDSRSKTHVLNMVDTPGHPDFHAETSAAVRGCDGIVHVVDVMEGPTHASFSSPKVVVFNKLDSLVLDHRLPPVEAFRRIKSLAEEMHTPLDEIVYASSKFQFVFTLRSVAQLYMKYHASDELDLDLSKEQSFVDYVLAPIYKLVSCGLVGPKSSPLLQSLGIELTQQQWESDYDTRIRSILQLYFETGTAPLVDAILKSIPSPGVSGADPVPQDLLCRDMATIYHESVLYTVGRVVTGTLRASDTESLWIPLGTRKILVDEVHPGSFYMTPAHLANGTGESAGRHDLSVVKVGLEVSGGAPGADQALTDELETLCATHPALKFSPSENGIYYVYAPGELYLDSCLQQVKSHGLRLSTSQAFAEFHETVSSESYLELPVASKDFSLAVIASPYNEADHGNADLWHVTEENCYLYGPSPKPEHDDTIVGHIVQGFRWFAERGPLTDGIVRDAAFRITELQIEGSPGPQLSVAVHRACNAAMLVASPRLVEPWFRVTVIGGLAAGKACYAELGKRGGSVVRDMPIVGTSLYRTEGLVPVMDSFGLQVDIQCQLDSRNQSKVLVTFDGWREVAGDPLDTTAKAPRLKPASEESRARDFMVKTRRLKGLAAEPDLGRYIDENVSKLVG